MSKGLDDESDGGISAIRDRPKVAGHRSIRLATVPLGRAVPIALPGDDELAVRTAPTEGSF